MTNIVTKLAADPNHGRRAIDHLTKQASTQLKAVSTSRPFVAFVIVSAVALGFYYFIMAAPIYVSQTSFQIRGIEKASAGEGLLAAFGGGGGGSSPSASDIGSLEQYAMSYEMASKLDQRFHLRDRYAGLRLDFLHWLPRNASREDFVRFYRKMVRMRIDHDTSLITVEAKALDPVLAQQMAQAILGISSDYINNLSGIVRRETLRSSEQELQKAEDAARQARLAMTSYRAETGMIDPTAEAAATSSGVAGMQQSVLQDRAQITQLLSFNTANSPEVKKLQAHIAGLEQQILAEQRRVSNTEAKNSIAQRLREYEGLMITSEYADKQLVAALGAYDSAKTLASQRERFIVPAIQPNLPQTATEPNRIVSFLEALFVLVALYGVVALAIAGVRDHQGI